MKGRIGLAIAPSDGKVVYALVEADSNPNPKGKLGVGKPQTLNTGLYRSGDGGTTWVKTATSDVRPFYYSQVRVDPKNPDRVYWSSTPINVSNDGGKTVGQTTVGVHVDHHAMWIDPNNGNRIVVGDDGGVSESFDKGGNWLVLNSIAVSQLYDVSYDFAVPYNVCGGLQDNGAWCGPSRRKSGPITNSMWYTITGGDGFYTAQDPTDPHIVYGESQGGGIARVNVATGESVNLAKPNARARIAAWEDTVAVLEDDSAKAATVAGKKRIADIRAMIAADSTAFALRWNWETPYFLSPHNPRVLYAGSNRVMKSVDRGDGMYPISPDLSYNDSVKVRVSTRTTGGITTDATGAETFATIVSLAESYVRPGLLFAGTDDGRTWFIPQRWRELGRADEPVRRRAGWNLRVADRAVARRYQHLLRHLRRSSQWRLHAVRVRHQRHGEDVPFDREQPAARRSGLRACGPGRSREPERPLRGYRCGGIRLARIAAPHGSASMNGLSQRCRCTTSRFSRP